MDEFLQAIKASLLPAYDHAGPRHHSKSRVKRLHIRIADDVYHVHLLKLVQRTANELRPYPSPLVFRKHLEERHICSYHSVSDYRYEAHSLVRAIIKRQHDMVAAAENLQMLTGR
jgi:hypothetical protein